ncbi:DUF3221 domain-containing protein [Bacillus benzoevorans]|uniref:DUF3221 domain-containing protein n=1 Tax=Bacillus benzoevorans TaxID=1456 RepID=UPI0035EBF89E
MIKKISILFTTLFIGLLLAACQSDDKAKNNEVEATFTGTISEINQQNALVDIETGDILKSGDKVYVDLSKSEANFKVGDKVEVGYDGVIRESYPLGINVVYVELIKR